MKYGDLLFDLQMDPDEKTPLQDGELEDTMKKAMIQLLKENEAPEELYERIDLQ